MNLARTPEVMQTTTHLGYPAYFPVFLGFAKILGASVLILSRSRRMREWAYAGFAITLLSAVFSHLAVRDPLSEIVSPLGVLALMLLAYGAERLRARTPRQAIGNEVRA